MKRRTRAGRNATIKKEPAEPRRTRAGRKIKEEPISNSLEPSDQSTNTLQPVIDDSPIPSTSSGNLAIPDSPLSRDSINNKSPVSSSRYVPLESAIEIVPNFDSKDDKLLPFLRQCKAAESFVRPEQRPFFILLIRTKITGFASDLIDVYEKEPNTLDKLIAALKLCFPLVFDVNKVFLELWSQRQEEHESVELFAARISRLLYRGFEAADDEKSDVAKAVDAKAALDSVATSQFINGLRDLDMTTMLNETATFKETVSLAIRRTQSMNRRLFNQERLEQEQPAGSSDKVGAVRADTRRLANKFVPYNKAFCNHCRKRGHMDEHCWFK